MQRFLFYKSKLFFVAFSNFAYILSYFLGFKFIFTEIDLASGVSEERFLVNVLAAQMWWGIQTMFVRKNLEFLADAINKGTLDFYLLKPFNFRSVLPIINVRIVDVVYVIFAFILMLTNTNFIKFGIINIFLSIVFFIIGLLITYFFASCAISLIFWTGRDNAFFYFLGETSELIQLPIIVFPFVLKIIFIFIVPAILFVSPAVAVLFGENDLLPYIGAILMLFITGLSSNSIWRRGIRAYTSAN